MKIRALVVSLSLVASAQASITGTLVVSRASTNDPRSLRLTATLHNGGSAPFGVAEVPLSIAQLSIDVRDAAGHRLGTIPPPVPQTGDDGDVVRIAPFEAIELEVGPLFLPAP